MYDLRPLIDKIRYTLDTHKLGARGEWARWIWQDESASRELGLNEYGVADANNILYTIDAFECSLEEKNARVSVMQSMQNQEDGLFYECTHHPLHTTAHLTGALELYDARPLRPLTALHRYKDKDNLTSLIYGLDWGYDPWPESHQGAGVYAGLVNAGEDSEQFRRDYFDILDGYCDSKTGFWGGDYVRNAPVSPLRNVGKQASIYTYMGAGFHYMFNYMHEGRPLLYPDKIVDTCIDMYLRDGLPDFFMKRANFIEVDWLYCLRRAMISSQGHRQDECMALIRDFASKYLDFMLGMDHDHNDSFNDLHMLFGAVCCLAELQYAMPDDIKTDKPLRLVLERRPFI